MFSKALYLLGTDSLSIFIASCVGTPLPGTGAPGWGLESCGAGAPRSLGGTSAVKISLPILNSQHGCGTSLVCTSVPLTSLAMTSFFP